jgi:hypothetical protein
MGTSLRVTDGEGKHVRAGAEEFIAHYASKPRGIIVSAQMLLEGFDDPEINTVVITYPSSSMIVLMQAAGRCVRHAVAKDKCFVLQARNDSIAYHFDQRWLYQEISDYLRPQLLDVEYADLNDLKRKIKNILNEHKVVIESQARILGDLNRVSAGERCRILLAGLPYYGEADAFAREACWSAILETLQSSEQFRDLFNRFSALGADLSDPSDFLRKYGAQYGIGSNFSGISDWRLYTNMLTAMYFARKEVYESGSLTPQGLSRSFCLHGATWLKYCTFHYRPCVPARLVEFFSDCHNGTSLLASYQEAGRRFTLALKLPLPLGGSEGYLFEAAQSSSLQEMVDKLRLMLRSVEPA